MAKKSPQKLPFLEFLFLLVFVLCLGVGVAFMYGNTTQRVSTSAFQGR